VPALDLAPGLSFLITGTSTTSWAGLQLPAQLNIPGFAPSCELLQTSIDFVDPVAQRPAPQTAPIFFFIPNIPSLLGIHYWQQGIVFSPDPSGPLVMLSRAGHGVIGT
jgi:hypothetical protein